THLAYELRVEDNWFIDNDCMGLWIDNTWRKVRIARNIFLGNRGQDIFFEMDDNTPATASLVDHNLFLPGRPELLPAPKDPNAPGPKWSPWSVGIYGHDADGVRIFRNYFAGEGYGLYFRKMTDRKGGASYISASGNVFANSNLTAVCLPAENPPLVRSNWFEANVYPAAARPFVAHAWSIKTGGADAGVIARLSRAVSPDATAQPFGNPAKPPYGYFLSLKQWQTVMNFDQHSRMVAVPWTFDRQTWELTVTLPDELSGIPVPSEREAGEDFFGRPTSAGALAGPFENLTPGKHILKLPRPVGERAVP
ncbi:MAG TPA: hypothetical protein VNT26_16515, partial [Candidatus Sulfotelmatobacter sp.]|nr:hypothetical protein [Candidatus Sulfotelmatobacter sp.]